ncbi:zinc finger protein 37-like [Oscarella lobularis]|uniref:zinc finger protein 37-like n=1 Tax=Oscarella lobularis TaxID=121494 RepID=UPI0033141A65
MENRSRNGTEGEETVASLAQSDETENENAQTLSTIAKAIDKHIDGDLNKRIVFDVFRQRDSSPDAASTASSYRTQNAILAALLSLDQARQLLANKASSSFAYPPQKENSQRKRRRRHRSARTMMNRKESRLIPSASSTRRSLFPSKRQQQEHQDASSDNELLSSSDEDDVVEYNDSDGSRKDAVFSKRRHRDDDGEDESYRPLSPSSTAALESPANKKTGTSAAAAAVGSESTCDWCHKKFGTTSALFMHIKYKHPHVRLSLYQCQYCSVNYYFKYCIERHIQVKHPHVSPITRGYRVTPGSEESTNESSSKGDGRGTPVKIRASGGGGGGGGVKCSKCDKTFHSAKYLEEHVTVMHSLQPPKYRCPVCHKSFTWISNMRQHVRTMHQGVKRKRIASPSQEKKSIAQRHKAGVVKEYSFDATEDDSRGSFYNDRVSTPLKYPCRLCNKSFGTVSGRWRHMHNKHNAPKMRTVGASTDERRSLQSTPSHDYDDNSMDEVDGHNIDDNDDDFTMFSSMKRHSSGKSRRSRKKDPDSAFAAGSLGEDGEKKDKPIAYDRFNYQCTVCLEKFPYPISLFNHMKHIHNSTSAGILGTPKEGLQQGKNERGAVASPLSPPPLMSAVENNHSFVATTDDMIYKDLGGDGDEGEKRSSVRSSVSTVVSDDVEGSPDFDQEISRLLCDDEEVLQREEADDESSFPNETKNDFEGAIDESSGDIGLPSLPRYGANDEEEEENHDDEYDDDATMEAKGDDEKGGGKSSGRRPMGTGDKICATCGKSYHWSAGLWRHQKSTGHNRTTSP